MAKKFARYAKNAHFCIVSIKLQSRYIDGAYRRRKVKTQREIVNELYDATA